MWTRLCLVLLFGGIILAFGQSSIKAQADTDIYLFDLEQKGDSILLSNVVNVTEREGYDNQPCFHSSKPIIFYSSFDENDRSDIKHYDFEQKKSANFTTSDEREYSPTVTPDGKFISCIIQLENDAQNLGKFPIEGGDAITLIDDLTVGYHCWASDHELILFVLGPTMDLVWRDLESNESTVLANNIGRSLHKIPGEAAMSFVQKPENETEESGESESVESESSEDTDATEPWTIMRLDLKTKKASPIAETLEGREDLAWLADGTILMSDGENLFSLGTSARGEKNPEWKPVDLGGAKLTGVTRIAVSSDGKHVAIVADDQ